MSNQHVLVQCPVCKRWYIVPCMATYRGAVSFAAIYAVEETLRVECRATLHRGRRRASLKE
jgi:hypothetical protein